MKRFVIAALAALSLLVQPAVAIPPSSTGYYTHPKSPLRYVIQTFTFSTTANISASQVGVVPPSGATLVDIVVAQSAAGVGGTSWVATPKINGVALDTTDGGFTLAAGANKSTNTVLSKMGALTNPAGGTRPVIKTDGTATATGGQLITMDVTLTGTYTGAVTGTVTLYFLPKY